MPESTPSHPAYAVDHVAVSIRRHWGIDNNLDWVLDMAFHEDAARHRAGNCASIMTLLRHWTFNILKKDPTRKLGISNTRKRAGWDHSYLLSLINRDVI